MAYKSLWTFFKFSWTRKLFFKALYEILPRLSGQGDWQFMNYGYSPSKEEALESQSEKGSKAKDTGKAKGKAKVQGKTLTT